MSQGSPGETEANSRCTDGPHTGTGAPTALPRPNGRAETRASRASRASRKSRVSRASRASRASSARQMPGTVPPRPCPESQTTLGVMGDRKDHDLCTVSPRAAWIPTSHLGRPVPVRRRGHGGHLDAPLITRSPGCHKRR
eukprot:g31489.t1